MPAATGNFVLDKGYRAAAALTKRRFCKFSAAETVTPITAIGDMVAGVVLFGVTAPEITKGKGATVRQQGIAEVEASAAIAIGALCEIVSDGRVRTATASSAARIVGRCVGAPAAQAGDVISLEIDIAGGLVGATF